MKSDINWREMNLENYEEFIIPNSEALLLIRTDISYRFDRALYVNPDKDGFRLTTHNEKVLKFAFI